jgi:hypothetical protein
VSLKLGKTLCYPENHFDMNEVHFRDFKKYSAPFGEYMMVYFIGHYNPRGNLSFAKTPSA